MKREVIIAGIPRSGTTFLCRSISGVSADYYLTREINKNASVLRTHSLAPPYSFRDPFVNETKEHVENKRKIIFLFGDAVESIISTRLRQWNPFHATFCGVTRDLKYMDIYDKDCFNHEIIFDSWMSFSKYPILRIRYETMNRYFEEIEKYLGRPVKWNAWKPRGTNRDLIKLSDVKRIEKTYTRLQRKISCAKDFEFR